MYPCPCCGYIVFTKPPGSFDICPVCGWEDDDIQLYDPLYSGGANKESLLDKQTEFINSLREKALKPGKYERDMRWRPLTKEDCNAQRS